MKRSARDDVNRVLVTGGAGYLGSSLVSQLLQQGLKVRVLDSMLFGEDSVSGLRSHAQCELIRGDVRDVETVVRTMTGCDSVIHLAGIVGDHACNENQQLAQEVNRAATRMLADVAPRCGVRRFLFASSCSVYGSSAVRVNEESAVRPLSLYAQTKVDSEQILLSSRTRDFAPTILRLGTLFGLSARMRFDLVVNLLLSRAISTGRISINNGWQWRPFVHVRDAARAFLACLHRPTRLVSREIFNVGANSLNLRIRTLGAQVARMLPGTAVAAVHNDVDRRSYRVSFDKIERRLGFVCDESLERGIREVISAIRSGAVVDLAMPRLAHQNVLVCVTAAAKEESLPLRQLVVERAEKKMAACGTPPGRRFKAVSLARA